MDFGFAMPPRGPTATPENIAPLTQQGEAMGFGILVVTDHIILLNLQRRGSYVR